MVLYQLELDLAQETRSRAFATLIQYLVAALARRRLPNSV